MDKIVMIVKQLMKQHDEEIKPLVDDINRPELDDVSDDHYEDDNENEEGGEDFVYFYDDDEGAFHDEL